MSSISTLPTELIENILLHGNNPSSLASFSQTCRAFRSVIYDPADQHLWHQLFLADFDDPTASSSSSTEAEWGPTYRARVQIMSSFRAGLPLKPDDIDTLLAVIDTASRVGKPGLDSAEYPAPSPTASYPIFPPVNAHKSTDCDSKNITWLKELLHGGYPRDIVAHVINSGADLENQTQTMRMYKLLCRTGLSVCKDGAIDGDVQQRLRHWARKKVYNIRYLDRARNWGPFLPSGARPNPIVENQPGGFFAAFHNHLFGLAGYQGTIPIPKAEELRVDWEYLFGVRKVLETNLKEVIVGGRADEILKGLVGIDGLRPCSAPGARMTPPAGVVDDNWDWAGVTGVWRRCICWMDYRDLILNNLESDSTRFADAGLGEAIRIVPMRLRVVSYSPGPAAWPHRPTLHVEGEQGGPLGSSEIRHVRGTVGMTADGEIRFNLFSRRPEEREDEWVTEGIQVGNVGSGMGILGLWTGAKHERSDPLGPFWAWKMA